ncbi:killer cell lectin-like receptor subfamily F member 1 [Sphaerodactylus townsendi]|uniref:killer cell lectin-like receptor subfamily F member 1 n=1 Tax=Sphaerodactylus townsendi TaxID=933632 RepID=UPI002027336A|nr:killer cell lectin-like receptor subfamily F member 1 [Sphaerodactylus townsendi]
MAGEICEPQNHFKLFGECNDLSVSSSPVNSTCQICLPHWYLHLDKCYWPSKALKTWNESQSDCSEKGAQLVVIQNKEEMEFLKKFTEDAQIYWTGLSVSSSAKKWVWITGHKVDQNLFQEPPISDGGYNCGAIKSGKIMSDICTAVLKWICQQDPILL